MDEKSRKTILWKLFISTLYLSAFTFGGGYVIVTLMKNKFVDEYHWIEENEMLDLVAIAQSSPGAIAVNGAIVIGYLPQEIELYPNLTVQECLEYIGDLAGVPKAECRKRLHQSYPSLHTA